MAAISISFAASTFSRSSGSVLDGRRLNHQEAANEVEMAAIRDEVLGLVRGTTTRSE